MICPNCGNKIADDKLLCEVCGAEINFVPDFEPEIEQSINESLSDISDYVETPDYFPEGEEPVFGYYDENGNFVETPGYFDENGNFVELTGFYDEFGNFIETIPVVDENGNEVYVPGYFDENGEPVFLDPYDGGEYQDFAEAPAAQAPKSEKKMTEISRREKKKPEPPKSKAKPSKPVSALGKQKSKPAKKDKSVDTVALAGISAPDGGPKVVRNLSDSLYDEMYADSTLTEFDSEYEIDPFDDFAYESYYIKKFCNFVIHSKAKWFILAAVVLLVFGIYKIAGSVSEKIYQSSSYEYQTKLVDEAAARGDYQAAIEYMEKALTLNSQSGALKYKLSQYYFNVGDDDDALLMLWEIINLNDGNAAIAYNDMVNYYVTTGNYEMAAEVLNNCYIDSVKEQFIDYMADAPEFSLDDGVYEDEQMLYLSSNIKGTIYYNMNGADATTEDEVYQAPIKLERGIIKISALFVNDYGIKSEVVHRTFTIDNSVPNPPIVMTEGGDYEEPELIEVDVQAYTDVYYTLDGTVPNMNSALYLSPIPMPIGSSTVVFIAYSQEGIPGPVTEVSYNLTVDTPLNVDGVIGQLYAYNKNSGRAVDYNGLIPGGNNYTYSVSQAIKINDHIYYIFVEYLKDMFGNQTKTNNLFLVDTGDGTILLSSLDTMGNIIPGAAIDPALLVQIPDAPEENNTDN